MFAAKEGFGCKRRLRERNTISALNVGTRLHKSSGEKAEKLIGKSSCGNRRERSKNMKMKSGQGSHQKSGARCNPPRARLALPQRYGRSFRFCIYRQSCNQCRHHSPDDLGTGSSCARKGMATATSARLTEVPRQANHVRRRYFFEEPGGNCLNILSTPLSRFLMFLLELLESVSLELPLQISCLVFVSKRSTTTLPPLYVSVVVLTSPKPPPPKRLKPQPPPNPS